MPKTKIYRAGMIIYHIPSDDPEIKILFMVPSDPTHGTKYPQIPKGKVEENETSKEAAIREAKEEVGLFPPNIEGNINLLGRFLGRTDIFIAKVKDPKLFGDFHFETKRTVWLTPEEFQQQGRDLHKPIIKAAVRYIYSIMKNNDE